jgi:hypothetical protein
MNVEGASYAQFADFSEGNVAVGFAGPFGYVGPVYADGNNLTFLHQNK